MAALCIIMNEAPNKEKLKICISDLAAAMGMKSLPEELSSNLIEHVLYKGEYQGVKGKNSWAGLIQGIITEREARNLLMAHSATKISNFNDKEEPGCNTYSTKVLCSNFEIALLGRVANLNSIDQLDPWEKNA